MSYYLLLLLGIILVLLVACQPAATIAPTAVGTPDTPSPTEPSATPSVAPTVTRADPTPTNEIVVANWRAAEKASVWDISLSSATPSGSIQR